MLRMLQRFFIAIALAVGTDDGTAGMLLLGILLRLVLLACFSQEVEGLCVLYGILAACYWGTADDVGTLAVLGRRSSYIYHWLPDVGLPCTGLTLAQIRAFVVSLMLRSLLSMSSGLVRGYDWRRLSLAADGLLAQFQCRLFHLDQALMFGGRVGFLVGCFGLWEPLPGGLGRFVPCGIGANHCRLRHIGWEKSGHGLTSGSL